MLQNELEKRIAQQRYFAAQAFVHALFAYAFVALAIVTIIVEGVTNGTWVSLVFALFFQFRCYGYERLAH